MESTGRAGGDRDRGPRDAKRDKHVVDVAREHVMSLPPGQPCLPGMEPLLAGFTASALAALLKELASKGAADRAYEIFRSLHALGPTHLLSHLLDVYTYTTIISQCESSQSVERALALMQMMKDSGIACNVHTYSAFMKVCIRANNLDLALTAYQQILEDGLTPTLITYNTLIDVLGSKGNSLEVIDMLKTIKERGLNPEVRTYNMAIRACVRAGSLEHALEVYKMLLEDGKQPCASTFTSLLSSFGKEGKLDACKEIFTTMKMIGVKGDVMTYSAMINACAKAGSGTQALEIFADMKRLNIAPTIITFNCMLEACATEGLCEEAEWLYAEVKRHNLAPDVLTVRALYKVYVHTGLWYLMLQHFLDIDQPDLMEDLGLANRVLDILWNTGVAGAQVAAMRLLACLLLQRHPKLLQKLDSSLFTWSSSAATPGAASACMLLVLFHIAQHADQVYATPDKVVTVLFTTGRMSQHGTTGHLLAQTVAGMLTRSHIPAVCSQIWGGMQVSLPLAQLLLWLQTPTADELLKVAKLAQERTTSMADVQHELAADTQCNNTFRDLMAREKAVFTAPYTPSQHHKLREMAVYAISQQAVDKCMDMGIAYQAIFLLDIFFNSTPTFDAVRLPNLCEAALDIAREQETGVMAVRPGHDAELENLQRGRSCCSPLQMFEFYLQVLQLQTVGRAGRRHSLYSSLTSKLPELFSDPVCAGYPPSFLAAAFLAVLRHLMGAFPVWPAKLQLLTGFVLDGMPRQGGGPHRSQSVSALTERSSYGEQAPTAMQRLSHDARGEHAADEVDSLNSLHQICDTKAHPNQESQGAPAKDESSNDEGANPAMTFKQLVDHVAVLIGVSMQQQDSVYSEELAKAFPPASVPDGQAFSFNSPQPPPHYWPTPPPPPMRDDMGPASFPAQWPVHQHRGGGGGRPKARSRLNDNKERYNPSGFIPGAAPLSVVSNATVNSSSPRAPQPRGNAGYPNDYAGPLQAPPAGMGRRNQAYGSFQGPDTLMGPGGPPGGYHSAPQQGVVRSRPDFAPAGVYEEPYPRGGSQSFPLSYPVRRPPPPQGPSSRENSSQRAMLSSLRSMSINNTSHLHQQQQLHQQHQQHMEQQQQHQQQLSGATPPWLQQSNMWAQ